MDRSQEQPDAPAWLRALPAIAHAYVNAQADSELAAADASLMRIASSRALRKSPPTVRLSVKDTIAEAYVARNMRTGEAAALDSAVTTALEMAEDARAQFGVGSSEAAAAMTAAGYYLANRALDLGDPSDAERSISLLREAMDNGAVPTGRRLWLFSGLGTALWARYSSSHDPGDLEQCITIWDAAKDEMPEESSDRPGLLRSLGVALANRFAISRDYADIDRAVELVAQAVAATPPGSPSLAGRRQALLAMLEKHFDATSQPADLDRMIDLLQALAQGSPPPLRRRYLALLASTLDDKVSYFRGSLADLRRAADALETAVAESPADDPELPEYQAHLAMALHQVGEPTGDLKLANRAAGLAAGALHATPPTSPRWPVYARDLAVILSGRARKTRNRSDVEEAIRLLQQIDVVSWAGPDAYLPRVSLSNAFLLRFQLGGAAGDLDRAVELMEEAVSCTNPMTPQRLVARRNLARALQARHAVTGRPADVERLSSLQQERSHATDLVARYAGDPKSLLEEYEATSDLTALDAAMAGLDAALAAAPGGSPEDYDGRLKRGLLLWRKYEHTGDIDLLGQAILVYEDLLAETPAGSVTCAWAQARRGLCLRDRYVRTADDADLDRAITDYREVLRTPDLPHPLRYEVYGNLGLALWDRYGVAGNLQDLDDAIMAIQARATIPGFKGHDDTALNTLGLALRDRYLHSEDPQDLAGAVRAHEQAVALSMPMSPRYGARLNSLGGTYFYRWFHARDLADLDRAILAFERASAAGEPGQANRLRSLADLASCLRHRYIKLRAPADLDRAVAVAEAAVAGSAAGWAESNLYLYNLAGALRTRYDQVGQHSDLQRAVAAYRACCAHAQDARASTALEAAASWCRWASRRGAWREAAEAGEFAVAAMVRLFENQFGRPHKEAWLAASSGIPVLAAYALAMAGEPARAAVALESGRALLLSEALRQDRADLDALRALGHGGFADRYLEAAERWRRLLAMAGQPLHSQPQPSGTVSPPLPGLAVGASAETSRFVASWQQSEQLKAARAALDAAIEAIRHIPGHKRFLQAPGIEDIRAAAAASPLVYLAAAEHGGMALIVRPPADGNHAWESPHVIGLPELTAAEVSRWARTLRDAHERRDDQPAWRGALDAVTARLWTAVMGPVIKALDGAETAVLIPAGQLVMLPLHAAWTTGTTLPGGRRYAADETCLSYAPNAASLSAAAVAANAAADSLLLVKEPRPSARGPLPFAGAEAAAATAPFTHITALRHENATVSAVLGALDGCSVQHFTCHAIADLASPLDSALILADDKPLTLREILKQRPGRPGRGTLRLAVLAACETQVPGQQLPDEVISLPAGLIQAGAAGVIASQWAVPGLATAMLMTRFYQYWKHDQLPPAAALRAAQRWLRDTTNGEKADYFEAAMRDAPGPASDSTRTLWRAMIRKTPGDRAHAHINEWAAFVHTGA